MPFVPRTVDEIAESWLAKILARTNLTDISEGSALYLEGYTTAEEISHSEFRLYKLRNSFFLQSPDLLGTDLEERGKELPVNAVPKLGRTAASGAVMQIYRKSSLAVQVMPAGTLFKRSDGSNVVYKTIVDYTFQIGDIGMYDVYVVCTSQGEEGNAPIAVINQAVNAPEWIVSATNTKPISNGSDGESDLQYKSRLLLYLSSLARSQQSALEFLARSFTAIDGTRVRFAKCFVDNKVPGIVDLVVDDGFGMQGNITVGATASGVVPTGGQSVLPHEGPATAAIAQVKVVRGAQTLFLQNGIDMFSYPEMGYIEVPKTGVNALQAGDVWTITGYQVYNGILAELQQEVNGNSSDPVNLPGWKAAGVRVRVIPPTVVNVSMDLHVVPINGVPLATVQSDVLAITMAYMSSLAPGEPLYISQLIGAITLNPNVLNVRIYAKDTSTSKPDVYPEPREVLRSTLADLKFIAQV